METVPIFLFILVVFVNRYVLGLWLKRTRGDRFDETVAGWEPTVTIVVPMFNEGKSIADSIESFVALDYPRDKLSVIIVDDCSTDGSYELARAAAARHANVRVIQNAHNMGKRKGINHAVREATSEIIVSIDSDVIVDRMALRQLVARFTQPDVAAVGGRVHVSNADENWLSRMQTIKYFFGQQFLKNLERATQSVMCLSGCLTAYRRSVLIALEPILENRNVFGVPIKYGEDRFLTRQIVKAGYRTLMTMDACCYTKAPTTLTGYFNQQLRWKRSNIIDYLCGISHAWRLHPLVAVHYLSMFALLFMYPFVIALHAMAGDFLALVTFHVELLALLGMIYWLHPSTRKLAPEHRVHPIWFLPMAVLMPTAYVVMTPLALFTLHSSSWETRGHGAVAAAQPAKAAA